MNSVTKKALALLALIAVLFAFAAPVMAGSQQEIASNTDKKRNDISEKYYRIIDGTHSLTDDEIEKLDAMCVEFAKKHNIDLVIMIAKYSEHSEDFDNQEDLMYWAYTDMCYGVGKEHDGLVVCYDPETTYLSYDEVSYTEKPFKFIENDLIDDKLFEMFVDYLYGELYYDSETYYMGIKTAIEMLDAALTPNSIKLFDQADLLTDEQEAQVRERIKAFREKYSMELVILLDDSLYYPGKELYQYLADIYDYMRFGVGAHNSGVIFALDMIARRFETVTTGTAQQWLHYKELDKVHGMFEEDLTKGLYFDGIMHYIDSLEKILGYYGKDAENAGLKDMPKSVAFRHKLSNSFIYIILGSAVAAFIVASLITTNQSGVFRKKEAGDYIIDDATKITDRSDYYTHTTVKTKPISKSSSGGGGSSGSFTGSSGTSHGHSGGSF